MNRIYFSFSHQAAITARIILLGLMVFGLVLPVGAQAFQLSALTATPLAKPHTSPTPKGTNTPTPGPEYNSLSIPPSAKDLASDRALNILAGKLIFRGLVDASACANRGLLKSGAASPCGEKMAHNAVILWQNQFDDEIYTVARKNKIPPFILKNIFVKESQFWPETYRNPVYGGEYGLGHITWMGTDILLSWNRTFYKKICNQNYNEETCHKEYVFQEPAIKAGLQGIILKSINADCPTCVGGVDLQKTRNSISITAAVLIANQNYTEWLVNGFSAQGQLTAKNLWRFTTASYNGGPGCFSQAFMGTRKSGNPFSWKDMSQRFDKTCETAVGYVDFVMENVDTADKAALDLAAKDTSLAARMVLGTTSIVTFTPTLTLIATGTPTSLPLTATPTLGSETPTPENTVTGTPFTETPTLVITETPFTETPTATITGTPFTETPTPTAGSETPTPAITGTPFTETPTPTFTETPAVVSETPVVATATVTATSTATETPIPATATPITQPTAFVLSSTETGEIVVKFGGMVPEFLEQSTIGSAGGEIQSQVDALGLTIVSAPEDQVPQVLAYLQSSMLVDYAEPNYAVQAFYTPNDPGYINQTYLADMQIPAAWDVTKGEGVIVAVIDTGVDVLHPDLAANIWVNSGEDGLDTNGNDKRSNNIDDDGDGYADNWMGWNFVDNNNDARDGNGHGTHIAGIIAAQMDNTLGISGIAPNAKIMAIKALDNTGFGTYSQVAQAIVYAVDHGAQVINLGFGGTANSEALLAATNYAYEHNVIVVAAGGNTGALSTIYPAANPNVIAVSALNPDLSIAPFSTIGNSSNISAPGVGVYSTTANNNYATMSGTSMSAAQISGVVALLRSQPQFDTPDKVRSALSSTALDLGDLGADIFYGVGLARAFDALNSIPGIYPTPTLNGLLITPTPGGAGGVQIMAAESLWGTTATCTNTFSNTGGSTDLVFNTIADTCANFTADSTWTYGVIQDTTLPSIKSAALVIRLHGSAGWTNDLLEVSVSTNGTTWTALTPQIATISTTTAFTEYTYNVLTNFPNPTAVNNAQVRFTSIKSGGADTYTLSVDEIRLDLTSNDSPVANNDPYTAQKNVTLSVAAPGVLNNDTDANGDTLTAVLSAAPASGTLTLNPNGSFTYAPVAGFTGIVTFTYYANDGTINSAVTATVTINVTNTAPVAVADTYIATQNNTLTVSIPGVLSNDTDANGDARTAVLDTNVSNGALTLNANGSFTYVPTAGFIGTDSFTYHASDGSLSSNIVTVTISVTPPIEVFWGFTQACPQTFTNQPNSVIGPTFPDVETFDNQIATCSGGFATGTGWVFSDTRTSTGAAATGYASIYSATLDINFSMTGLTDDTYKIQFSPDNGTSWFDLETFDATALPPATLRKNTYIVSSVTPVITNAVDTPAEVNNFQARIQDTLRSGSADTVTINIDQIALTVVQNTAPTISITAPGNGTSHVQGRLVAFTGTANDGEEGVMTGSIIWKEGATTLGAGGSFNTTTLSLGAHTITANITDNRGLTASASVTITIIANTAPTVAITTPLNNSTYAKGAPITFTGTATDAQDGNVAPNLLWISDIDGPLATGASFSIDHLIPGTHTIIAQVTDIDGATGSATIIVTVTPDHGPHGAFNGSTDGCANCHRSHSALSSGGDLLNNPNSAYTDNAFCLSCHSSGSSAISTHSNIDGLGKKEANFELLCVQCHDPHGAAPNLFAVRGDVRIGSMPTAFDAMTPLSTPVVFTALKNANSFDEVDVPEDAANNADDICVTCHVSPANPGAPIFSHAGGSNHLGSNNYAGQSCISCHPHNSDSNSSTKDGFMPVRGSCIGCHSTAQGTRRAIVGAGGDFVRSSHHANASVTDTDCQLCHDQSQHMQGKVRLLNVDTSSTVYALDGTNDPTDYENFCLSCHDSNGAKGDTSPFSDNVNMAGTSLQINLTAWNAASHNLSPNAGSCINCHDNGHGSNKTKMLAPWNYTSTGTPAADLMKQEEYFCYDCHKSGGVASTNVMTNYTLPTRWVQLAAGENNLTTLNDRHDISTPDQTTSGTKMECVTCHNPHTDNSSFKVITDPDPTDGRVPGTGYFSQGNTTDFFSDWCLDCHDGSYPLGVTPPTNALTNIYTSMSVNTHGAATGNVSTLESGFGYTTNSIVQCRQCHGNHVQAPTPVTSTSNFFALLTHVRNASGTADIPTDPTAGNSFQYEFTNNSTTTVTTSGYNWCQTCHTGSMGANKTNCASCHYHGASGKW